MKVAQPIHGALGAFARALIEGPPYGTDCASRVWRLLPLVPAEEAPRAVERERTRSLVQASLCVLVVALRRWGADQHAQWLTEAMTSGSWPQLLWERESDERIQGLGLHSIALERVLSHLRVRPQYDHHPVGRIISAGFWATNRVYDQRHRDARTCDRQAAESAGELYAHWGTWVGEVAYDEAADAMRAAILVGATPSHATSAAPAPTSST